ncbi:MAG: phenylalanine--tRNA ligase subunit alpha [Patescibacteria group bacterium]
MKNPSGSKDYLGHIHPITQASEELCGILREIGFSIVEGPEIETDHYNFEALNFPADHPARDMQDTFWLKGADKKLLRTHTSPVQIRYMESHKPPFAIAVPGKVFRNEATDASHEAQFFQLEGLYVDKEVSMANLKGVLLHLFKKYFGEDAEIRFRPSFFPFVEPGVEVDMQYKGKWLEMMGAGLVHPNVLSAAGVDPKKWQGFAFGGGIDRFIAIKLGLDDIRHLYTGDLRLINQF